MQWVTRMSNLLTLSFEVLIRKGTKTFGFQEISFFTVQNPKLFNPKPLFLPTISKKLKTKLSFFHEHPLEFIWDDGSTWNMDAYSLVYQVVVAANPRPTFGVLVPQDELGTYPLPDVRTGGSEVVFHETLCVPVGSSWNTNRVLTHKSRSDSVNASSSAKFKVTKHGFNSPRQHSLHINIYVLTSHAFPCMIMPSSCLPCMFHAWNRFFEKKYIKKQKTKTGKNFLKSNIRLKGSSFQIQFSCCLGHQMQKMKRPS